MLPDKDGAVRPVGRLLAHDFDRAGGVPALLAELEPVLELEAPPSKVARSATSRGPLPMTGTASGPNSVAPVGAITAVFGKLAPDGAAIKQTAARAELLEHRGPAGVTDMLRISDARRVARPSGRSCCTWLRRRRWAGRCPSCGR